MATRYEYAKKEEEALRTIGMKRDSRRNPVQYDQFGAPLENGPDGRPILKPGQRSVGTTRPSAADVARERMRAEGNWGIKPRNSHRPVPTVAPEGTSPNGPASIQYRQPGSGMSFGAGVQNASLGGGDWQRRVETATGRRTSTGFVTDVEGRQSDGKPRTAAHTLSGAEALAAKFGPQWGLIAGEDARATGARRREILTSAPRSGRSVGTVTDTGVRNMGNGMTVSNTTGGQIIDWLTPRVQRPGQVQVADQYRPSGTSGIVSVQNKPAGVPSFVGDGSGKNYAAASSANRMRTWAEIVNGAGKSNVATGSPAPTPTPVSPIAPVASKPVTTNLDPRFQVPKLDQPMALNLGASTAPINTDWWPKNGGPKAPTAEANTATAQTEPAVQYKDGRIQYGKGQNAFTAVADWFGRRQQAKDDYWKKREAQAQAPRMDEKPKNIAAMGY